MDPWAVTAPERAKHDQQFGSLSPVNGIITGEQAKSFLLQSRLPPAVLGKIWGLADHDADGKMDRNEFSVACKLITMKLTGFEVPAMLPPALKSVLVSSPIQQGIAAAAPQAPGGLPATLQQPLIPMGGQPLIPTGGVPVLPPTGQPLTQPLLPGGQPLTQPLLSSGQPLTQSQLQGGQPLLPAAGGGGGGGFPVGQMGVTAPLVTAGPVPLQPAPQPQPPPASRQRSDSVISHESSASAQVAAAAAAGEWAVPQAARLKYTQTFNQHDRAKSGYLSGPQARNILLQSGLPNNVLAQIWALCDVDQDGRLSCEEFILALHLCERTRQGDKLTNTLPLELIPPSFRRPRTTSAGSQSAAEAGEAVMSPTSQASFEDRRRENYNKGQAELERRRKVLEDAQRREQEERARKEREEHERQERARQEQERRRQEELERQAQRQRELEQQQEEARRRDMEQRESARREMERKRKEEWETQKRQELENQRQKQQETVLKLKAHNTSLSVQLDSATDRVKELTQKIGDTRAGVTEVKSTIDGMRATRDSNMAQLTALKAQLREHNGRLLQVNQERAKLEARNKLNDANNPVAAGLESTAMNYDSKRHIIDQLRQRANAADAEATEKEAELAARLDSLCEVKQMLSALVANCQQIHAQHEAKRRAVLDLRRGAARAPSPPAAAAAAAAAPADAAAGHSDGPPTSSAASASASGAVQSGWMADFASAPWTPSAAAAAATDVWASPPAAGGAAAAAADAWGSPATPAPAAAGAPAAGWAGDTWGSGAAAAVTAPAGQKSAADTAAAEPWTAGKPTAARKVPYRALYEFQGRSSDEVSFQPGDIVMINLDANPEVSWLEGEVHGLTGWLPESYVEPVTGAGATTEAGSENGAPAADAQNAAPPNSNPADVTGERYVALFTYESTEPGDLVFQQGDVIVVTEKRGEWWTGRLAGSTGIFPSNYVQMIEDTAAEPTAETAPFPAVTTDQTAQHAQKRKGEVAVAIAPYESTSAEQLTLQRGQLVMVRKRSDTGWWEGEIQTRGKQRQVGWFPASFVKLKTSRRMSIPDEAEPPMPDSQCPGDAPSPDPAAPKHHVVAQFAYTAQNDDELTFQAEDVIAVINKDDISWWKGELNGHVGMFPSNYVAEKTADHYAAYTDEWQHCAYDATCTDETTSHGGDPASNSGGGTAETPRAGDRTSNSDNGRTFSTPAVQADDAASVSGAHSAYSADPSYAGDRSYSADPSYAGDRSSYSADPSYAGDRSYNADRSSYSADTYAGDRSYNADRSSYSADTYAGDRSSYSAAAPPETPAPPAGWSSLDEEERQRQDAIAELILSEEAYLASLSLVNEVFRRPLVSAGHLSREESRVLFVNWSDLVKTSRKLVVALRVRRKMSPSGVIPLIGDILCENLPHMTSYLRFCGCQLRAATLLQRKIQSAQFDEAVRRCQSERRAAGMPLSSFLLKPTQRVTKYPLLIKKILKHTGDHHPDHANLEEALNRAEELCRQVNDGVREQQNSDRLEWLQDHVDCSEIPERLVFNSLTNAVGPRRLLHFGLLHKTKSGRELVAFLFNDFVLLTTPSRPLGSVAQLDLDRSLSNLRLKLYRKPLLLSDLEVTAAADSEETLLLTSPGRASPSVVPLVVSLTTASRVARDLWIRQLTGAQASFRSQEHSHLERQQSLRQRPQGRLLITVFRGIHLEAGDPNGKSDPYCELTMGSQVQRTPVIESTLNPRWNHSMQFLVKDVRDDVLCVSVFDRDHFSPNEFLGRTEVRVSDVQSDRQRYRGPIIKRLPLHEVKRGEVDLKLDLQLFTEPH